MKDVPLTIKMRYGMREGNRIAHNVLRKIVDECPPQLITLHPRSRYGRTLQSQSVAAAFREQRYTRLAEWDYVQECADAIQGKTPLWAGGDVLSYEDYYQVLSTSRFGKYSADLATRRASYQWDYDRSRCSHKTVAVH